MPLQAEVVEFLRHYTGSPGEQAPLAPEEVVDRVEEHRVGDAAIPVRVYAPESAAPLPIVVYYHGGGWVYGDLEMHDRICRRIANLGHCVVVNVAYRLAPQHPFPTPMLDCCAALEWAAGQAPSLNGDARRLGVAGSSAGGNLAAAVALRARDEHGPELGLQVLIYPVLDSTMATRSYEDNRDTPVLTRDAMAGYWSQYVPSRSDRANPYASPSFAASLAGLPRTFIATAGVDPLCDEARAYAARLRAEGVEVTERHYEGQVHGFLTINADFSDSIDLTRQVGATIRNTFHDSERRFG
jgi:acetyl esterase